MKLTEEEIYALNGVELDAAVAEYVMGWHKIDVTQEFFINDMHKQLGENDYVWYRWSSKTWGEYIGRAYRDGFAVFEPSKSIEDAWMIVEHMMQLRYGYVLRGNFEGNGLHWCGFDEQEWADLNPLYQSRLCRTVTEAICQAALVACIDREK